MFPLDASPSHPFPTAALTWSSIGLVAMIAVGLGAQAKFKSGRAYLRYRDQNPVRTDFLIRAGFAALPLLWFSSAALIMMGFIVLYQVTGVNFLGVLGALSALAMIPLFIWAAKEFWSPSVRRRPSWWAAYDDGRGTVD